MAYQSIEQEIENGQAPRAKNLLLTDRGEKWLAQFSDEDKNTARQLTSSLRLISSSEFERRLVRLIEETAQKEAGYVALFVVREVHSNEYIFDASGEAADTTPRGSDIGSEGRVASILRNLARYDKKKYLVHPSLQDLRKHKCHAIFFVDDFIGSGRRVQSYLDAFYRHKTIKSWFSYKKLRTNVLAYAATEAGASTLRRATAMSPNLHVVRSCPTISSAFLQLSHKRAAIDLCKKYAKLHKIRAPLGFLETGALIVFEHGCPNNCPPIFWHPIDTWSALFHNRRLDSDLMSVFPTELQKRTPTHMLLAAGEKRIAAGVGQVVERPLPAAWLAVMSMLSRGTRKIAALEGVTGMDRAETSVILERCIASGLVSPRLRLTEFGRREFEQTKRIKQKEKKSVPTDVTQYYYPLALRGS
jgi:hypothetical protein